MDKLLTYAGYDSNGPHIFSLDDDPGRVIGHVKMARAVRKLPDKIEHYIKTAKPIKGKTQLLIDALGTGEYWGSNKNGDFFPESALSHKGMDYGYQTFMRYGHPFKHHRNKNPSMAYGDRVTLSDYDKDMHRVLLIISIHNDRCHDIINDLSYGRYRDVSMGCRVPWDQCSICGNRARNRAAYCNHLKFQMNRVLRDGRRICAHNLLPKFFDISFVTVGAEKASHVLSKVAGYTQDIGSAVAWDRYAQNIKKTSGVKSAVMKKRLTAGVENAVPLDGKSVSAVRKLLDDSSTVKAMEPSMSPGMQDDMCEFDLDQVFSTLASIGIVLRPDEFQKIVLTKMGNRRLAEKLASDRVVFDEFSPGGSVPGWAANFGTFSPEAMTEKVALMAMPYMRSRSIYPDLLASRIERFEKSALDGNMVYNRDSQWYPMTGDQKKQSSGMYAAVPTSLALASAFIAYKNVLPALLGKSTMTAALRKSWFIPILVGAGVGASVGISTMIANRPLGETDKMASVDAMRRSQYHTQKTAGSMGVLTRLGIPAAVYGYAGIRTKQAQGGRRLGSLDRAIVLNPGWAALLGFGIAPNIASSAKSLLKFGGIGSEVSLYAIGSPRGFMPGVLAAGLLDSLIFRGIGRLAGQGKGKSHGKYTR